RQDLYYRLKVVTLQIPPLRERRADIPELAHYFVDDYCRRNNMPTCVLLQETLQWLETLTWPGNVR
ncbi:MAG TPA: sigma-54-dependent Fis family transcriptional regulator, partial [Desulfobulbaceae bacterium]|nr:sigma-54-dependent Fis family transcriptional regulator [Desulfobulbaceae bacterium]